MKHMPDLVQQDLMLLPKYHAYANVMQDGENTGWVTIQTLPPSPTRHDAAEMYAASHARYGVDAKDTERDLIDLIEYTPDGQDPAADTETTQPVGRVKR